jgi:hypothetical protein
MALARIKTDKDNNVTFMAYANPVNWVVGQVLQDGSSIVKIDDKEYSSVNWGHAIFKDGHLTQDPNWIPVGPGEADPKNPTELEMIKQQVAQLTAYIAQKEAAK